MTTIRRILAAAFLFVSGVVWSSAVGTAPPAAAAVLPAGNVAIANVHGCAIVDAGRVKCWGENGVGQLGTGTQTFAEARPRYAGSVTDVIQLAVSPGAGPTGPTSCALRSTGTVFCWGSAGWGKLGDGLPINSVSYATTPQPVVSLTDATQITSGSHQSCALVTGGNVRCWGFLDAFLSGAQSSTPTLIAGITGATQISAGGQTTCALVSGSIKCWGFDHLAQAYATGIFTVPEITTATYISIGAGFGCAVVGGGAVKCWGNNGQGVLGDGTTNPSSVPVVVQGLSNVVSVATKATHSCAVLSGGSVTCWGSNSSYQLGDGTLTFALTPVAVVGVSGATSVDVGTFTSCASLASNEVKCWGRNSVGQVGNARAGVDEPVPARVETGEGFAIVSPARFLDTRDGTGLSGGARKMLARETLTIQVGGVGGVPLDATVGVLNFTVTEPTGPGFVTVFPCDKPRPLASNLNFVAGDTVPNLVTVQLSATGQVCAYTSADTHLIADISGHGGSGFFAFTGLTPTRILDSRDGTGTPPHRPAAGETLTLQVAGIGPVPISPIPVFLNVTVTEPLSAGFVTVYPCSEPRPNASNLNYQAGQTIANAVLAKLDASGRVCLYTQSSAHLIVDVAGYFEATGPGYVPVSPARILDTRNTIKVAAGEVRTIPVRGLGGLAGDATTAILNVTVTEPEAPGFVVVYPCDQPRPLASNVNFVAGTTIPNQVFATLDPAGRTCVYSSAAVHLVIDVAGSS